MDADVEAYRAKMNATIADNRNEELLARIATLEAALEEARKLLADMYLTPEDPDLLYPGTVQGDEWLERRDTWLSRYGEEE